MSNLDAFKKVLLGYELTINFNSRYAYIGMNNSIDFKFAIQLYLSPLLDISGGNQQFLENYFILKNEFVDNKKVSLSKIKNRLDDVIVSLSIDDLRKCLDQLIREYKLRKINEI